MFDKWMPALFVPEIALPRNQILPQWSSVAPFVQAGQNLTGLFAACRPDPMIPSLSVHFQLPGYVGQTYGRGLEENWFQDALVRGKLPLL